MLDKLLTAQVIDLSQPFETTMTARPMHIPFRMGSILRHGDLATPDGVTATLELIAMSTHTGTHIDALAHVAHEGKLYGDVDVESAMSAGAFTELGVETVSPLLYRGILLDVAGSLGVGSVEPTHRVSAQDLDDACRRQGVEVKSGDAALIRLGWGSEAMYGSEAYLGLSGHLPGVDVSAARWLVDHGVALTGTDTIAYECLAPGDAARPVHRLLLREAGIYILENLALDELSATGHAEFALVVAPIRFVGATGAPVRPVALLPG